MLRLAAPLALTELGWFSMNFVDTIAVGHLPDSAVAIGAVSVGTILFYCVAIFGSYLFLGLDPMISQAFGAGRLEDCHRNLFNALYLVLVLSPALMVLIFVLLPLLHRMGMDPAVVAATIPFVKALTWSTLPLSIYFVLRRYLQAMGIVKPLAYALVSANLVNLFGNWVFVYGHLGFRAFGVTGSGWSTFASRLYMVIFLAAILLYHDRRRSIDLTPRLEQNEPVLFTFPRAIARIYSADALVIHVGMVLLMIAGVFQLFDGVQVTITGALRGAGNTRTPMLVHLLGYWIVGIPLGALLCFKSGWGVTGYWIGLCVGLVLIGTILVFSWVRLTKQLNVGESLPAATAKSFSIAD